MKALWNLILSCTHIIIKYIKIRIHLLLIESPNLQNRKLHNDKGYDTFIKIPSIFESWCTCVWTDIKIYDFIMILQPACTEHAGPKMKLSKIEKRKRKWINKSNNKFQLASFRYFWNCVPFAIIPPPFSILKQFYNQSFVIHTTFTSREFITNININQDKVRTVTTEWMLPSDFNRLQAVNSTKLFFANW